MSFVSVLRVYLSLKIPKRLAGAKVFCKYCCFLRHILALWGETGGGENPDVSFILVFVNISCIRSTENTVVIDVFVCVGGGRNRYGGLN